MKKEFIGYYDPTEKEITDAWSKGLFAFDANTLLNLYRYSDLTSKDFLSALKTLKDKLFLPHQAALEFHTNRIGVIEAIENSYSNLNDVFQKNFEKNLEPQINQFKRHPSIIIETLVKLHSDFQKKIDDELKKQKKNHPDFKNKDEILLKLTELFENSIGKEFTKEELKKLYEEGKVRYSENIPPGFKDLENKRKKGDRHVYGDLIIWKELINYTKKEKKPLIFVTDDRKEDWWTIENGKTIRPREELIKEFFDLTGIRILIYSIDNFLHYAKQKKLVPLLKEKTIQEVKEIRISDEKIYLSNQPLTADTSFGNGIYLSTNPSTLYSIPGNAIYGTNSPTLYSIPSNQIFLDTNPSIIQGRSTNQVFLTSDNPNIVSTIQGNPAYLATNPITVSDILGNQANPITNPVSSKIFRTSDSKETKPTDDKSKKE